MCKLFFLTYIVIGINLPRWGPEKPVNIDYAGQTPPGITAELFAQGLVSTNNYEHSAPSFSPDGKTVLWTVVDRSYHAFLLEMKYEEGKWSAPHSPSFADSTADDYYPSFSADGKKLYFSSRRKTPIGYAETVDMRIWEVERKEDGWGTPVPFDTTASQGREYAHSITESGTIYFSAPLDGGTNMNICKSEKHAGTYHKPVFMPFNINSVDYEDGPYIAPDESFLIFESQRPEGIESSLDLYISFKNNAGRWSLPMNMGPKINTVSAERFAKLSPDGKYLFFGSNRNMNADNWGFDIYWIDAKVIDELRNNTTTGISINQPLGDELIDALYKNDVAGSDKGLVEWLTLYPNNLDAIVIYSSVLRKQKRYPEAESLLVQQLQAFSGNAGIILELALNKMGLKKQNEAADLLAPLLVNGERQTERYIYLSNALLDMRMFEESENYFAKAKDIQSNLFEHYRRARKYAIAGERERAFDYLEKAVAYGFDSRIELENDADLASLRSDVRWKLLLEKLK